MSKVRTAPSHIAAPICFDTKDQYWVALPHALTAIAMIVVVAIFHIWSRVQVIDLGLEINQLRRSYKAQLQEQQKLRLEVATLKAPARIEAIAKGALGMSLPTEQQVVVVR